MEFVDTARDQLLPLTRQVLEALNDDTQTVEQSFFTLLMLSIRRMETDADLMSVFLELSTTAFQGFRFSQAQRLLIDQLLEAAEDIALTLSVSPDQAH